MDYDTFTGLVRDQGGVEPDQVETVSCLAVSVLAQTISPSAAANLADRLPDRLRPYLRHDGPTESYGVDEYLRRLGRHLEAAPDVAESAAHAVLVALREVVGRDAYRWLRSELPTDFGPLFEPSGEIRHPELEPIGDGQRGQPAGEAAETAEPSAEAAEPSTEAAEPSAEAAGQPAGVRAAPSPAAGAPPGGPPDFIGSLTAGQFVDRVAERTQLDRERAALVTQAVLEALALRVTAGQIEDLRPFVPPELHAPLDRGIGRSHGHARRMSLDQFLDEVAVHEGPGVSREEARPHGLAVLSVLRDAVTDKEFSDTVAQLPKDYEAILPR